MNHFHMNLGLPLYHVATGLWGSSTAHDARVHGPYAFLSPSKNEFEVMPFTYGQCRDNLIFS